jgi:hypothetical protein
MTTPFWINDPTILFNKDYMLELWPCPDMCYERKLNAITRTIIILTLMGYLLTASLRVLFVGIATIIILFILFNMKKQKLTKSMLSEGFNIRQPEPAYSGPRMISNPATLDYVLASEFQEGTKKNPFSNVLLTEIGDNPDRKAAPPSFNVDVDEDITKNIKKAVQYLNPDIINTNKQLFGDLWDKFTLDQSNRVFFSTPNTRVANDQGAFAQYLYNDLKYSGKESTPEGAIARVQDNYRYTLY